MREIEILVKVNDEKGKVLSILEQFEKVGEKSVTDIYFYDPKRQDLQRNEDGGLERAFRIRNKNGQATMTYKIDYFDDDKQWIYSDEFETSIGDFDTTLKIIKLLGLEVLVTIENTKHTFITNKYEIVLEDVKDLGLYMEVEYLDANDKRDASLIKKEIWDFLTSLGINISEESNLGKPELMLRKLTEEKA